MFKFQKLVEKVAKATPNAQLPTALHMLVFPGAHIPSFCLKLFHSRSFSWQSDSDNTANISAETYELLHTASLRS